MKEKIVKLQNMFYRVGPQTTALLVTTGIVCANVAHADAVIDSIAEMIITIFFAVCVIVAGIFLIMGGVELAQAQADEGNGAEKKKAMSKFTAAAVLAVIAVLLKGSLGDTFKEILSQAGN